MARIVSSLLLMTAPLAALPLANPANASLLHDGIICGDSCYAAYLGFYGDYVYNRYMYVSNSNISPDVETFTINTNAAYFAATAWNRVEAFATVGASTIDFDSTGKIVNPATNARRGRVYFRSGTDVSWSVGGRCTLATVGAFACGVEGQYFRTKPSIESIRNEGSQTLYPSGYDILYTEWQVGLGASYYVGPMIRPYAGVMWAQAKTDANNAAFTINFLNTIFNMESSKLWAYALGISFPIYDEVGFTVEGRFAGQKALYVNGTVRF